MRITTVFILLITSTVLSMQSHANGDEKFHSENVGWFQLKYEASAFFMTAETTISLKTIKKATAAEKLAKFDAKDLLLPQGDHVHHVDVFSDEFGQQVKYQVWFESNGKALQRSRIKKGDKNEIKLTRYADCGYYRLRKKFPNKKFDEQFNDWDKIKSKYKAFPKDSCDGTPVVDSNSLLYLLGALDFSKVGDERVLLLESKVAPIEVKLIAKKETTIKASYKITDPSKSKTVDEKVKVLQIEMLPIINDKKDSENVKLLGLSGRVLIYLDVNNQLVLRINGDTRYVKNLDVNLKHAKFR